MADILFYDAKGAFIVACLPPNSTCSSFLNQSLRCWAEAPSTRRRRWSLTVLTNLLSWSLKTLQWLHKQTQQTLTLHSQPKRQTKDIKLSHNLRVVYIFTIFSICFPSITHLSCCVNYSSFMLLLPVRRGVCCRDYLLTLASMVLEIRGRIPRGC